MTPLAEQHIKKINLAGYSKDGKPVFHVETKGGHHRFLKKVSKNQYVVLGHGPSKTHARLMSEDLEKNIEWSGELFKNEDGKGTVDFSPSVFEEQAKWYAQRANTEDPISALYYTLKTTQYLLASGLNKAEAESKGAKYIKQLAKSTHLSTNPPYPENVLIAAYEIQYQKPFPQVQVNNVEGNK